MSSKFQYFDDADFEFEAVTAIGKASQGVMDVGRVLAVLERIHDGDATSWFTEWCAAAASLQQQADQYKAANKLHSAGFYFLAAADAYTRALMFVDGLPDDTQLLPTFRAHRHCWDELVATSRGRALPLAVPYAGGSMPGYLFRPDATGDKRPTLVVTNGSDGSLSGLWAEGIKAGLDRGWNVFVYDGPGQQSMLFERNIPFRYDWEAVLTPVVDALIARDDVDATGLLGFGISQGGYWLPRALAFEHRFAAAVADGGVMDVGATWNANLPQEMQALLNAGDREKFNSFMQAGGPPDPVVARRLAFRSRPYGQQASAFDLFQEVGKYNLHGIADKITTPLMVTDPDDEQFFPGQPQQLFDALTCPKVLVRFTREDGANHHCEPLARTFVSLQMCDFFEDHLATSSA